MDNKNITVFGCTGKTGREIVRQALEHGHFVTAYARNPQKLEHLQMKMAKDLDSSREKARNRLAPL
ncbi:NAD(P)H-binding protein [Paenibacillus sp. FSL R5-0766]|uniref:NAD(P)H-binding protein n=1 Tax=unclassified Paenibacillus TaxID=185978 RepID=UPI00096E6553|nr:NAD(P)H-binding protein [Paenibacillus sp. FSL R5-0765]OMF61300.1 hypothetical protein BK141_21255 [Paenibacillus sp. FSL R5-0765]